MEPSFIIADEEESEESEQEIVLPDKEKKKRRKSDASLTPTSRKKGEKDSRVIIKAKDDEIEDLKTQLKDLQIDHDTLSKQLNTTKLGRIWICCNS